MNNLPRITIVTPSFNQGQFLEATILSVIGQSYPNLEYIIMDGGSTDNSVDIMKKYENQISYWESEKDKGQSHAINKGFSRSTGDILMWINSDDMLMPNILHFIAQLVVENGDALYFGNCIHFKEDKAVWSLGSDVISSHQNIEIEQMGYIIQPSSFWTKNVWLETGLLNENMHFAFDWEWFIRVKHKNFKFFPIENALSIYRFHPAHKTGQGGNKRQLEILHSIYEKYYPDFAKLYSMVIEEINSQTTTWNKIPIYIYKKKCRIENKPFDYAESLKFTQPKKYKNYEKEDIGKIILML